MIVDKSCKVRDFKIDLAKPKKERILPEVSPEFYKSLYELMREAPIKDSDIITIQYYGYCNNVIMRILKDTVPLVVISSSREALNIPVEERPGMLPRDWRP